MAKIIFFDTETTGTSFWQHCIHQLSGIIEIDGIEVERFNYRIQPHPAAAVSDEALAVSGTTREQFPLFFTQKEVHAAFTRMLGEYVDKYSKSDKFYLAGYNSASFDNPFLRAFFKQCGDEYFGSWFWSCPIDVMVLAGQYLLTERSGMKDFKQSTVALHFGIAIDEGRLHDAVYDVEVCRDIYRYMYPL